VNLRRLVAVTAVATLGVLALAGNGSAALPTPTDCVINGKVTVVQTPAGRQVTATFDIKQNCPAATTVVTLAAFSKQGPGYVFPQALEVAVTGSFAPGRGYILSLLLPSCGFEQIDLVENLTPADIPANPPEDFFHSVLENHYNRAFAFSDVPCTPLCQEWVNPHGQNIPPAGQTPPGTNPRSGQNPDGFYLVGNPGGGFVFVVDQGSGKVFGPYPGGTVIKYTEANGATPNEKTIGSSNGQAGAVFTHITGTGDFQVVPVGGGPAESCFVPPPPK